MQLVLVLATAASCAACGTLPEIKHTKYNFPKDAYVGNVKRPYVVVGSVKSRVDYPSLDPNSDDKQLCRNYYNKAVKDLVKYARQKGADAVVDVKSVVFFEDGSRETYPTAECSDEGEEGQILAQGVAVRWRSVAAGTPETGDGTWERRPGEPLESDELSPNRIGAQPAPSSPEASAPPTVPAGTSAPVAAAQAEAQPRETTPALQPRDFSSVPVLGGELPASARPQAPAPLQAQAQPRRLKAQLPQQAPADQAERGVPAGASASDPVRVTLQDPDSDAAAPTAAERARAQAQIQAQLGSPRGPASAAADDEARPRPRKRRKRRKKDEPLTPDTDDAARIRNYTRGSFHPPSPTEVPGGW